MIIPSNVESSEVVNFLQECVEAGALNAFDIALCEYLMKGRPPSALWALIAGLSLATRQGHLCLDPFRLQEIWNSAFENVAQKKRFEDLAMEGARAALEQLSELSAFLVYENGYFYFPRFQKLEERICLNLERLWKRSFAIPESSSHKDAFLNADQQQALQFAFSKGLCFLTGGPGTGKTFTAAHLARAFCHQIRRPLSIGLCAPTGKAAAHLEKNFIAIMEDSLKEREVSLHAGTIHALFRIGKYPAKKRPLPASFFDLLIIDESSMIDAELFAALLDAIDPKTYVVFLGDPSQLAPVEVGSLFADVVDTEKTALPIVHLKHSLRTNNQELLQFADALLKADREAVENQIGAFLDEELSKAFASSEAFYDLLFKKTGSLDAALESWEKFRILSCLRKGPFGVDRINRALLERAVKANASSSLAIPILLAKTQSDCELSKGETGVLIAHNPRRIVETGHPDLQRDYALFRKGTEVRRIPLALLSGYEYAYCLSVHQSQGSEYEEVCVLVPPGSEFFGKEVLYTAATRSRKKLSLVSSRETLMATLQYSSRRLSGMKQRLQ